MIRRHRVDAVNIWETPSQRLFCILEENKKKKILLLLSGGSVVGMYPKLGEFLKKYNGMIALGQVDERFRPNGEWKMENARMDADINANAIWKTGLWEVCNEKKIPYFTVSQEGTLEESTRMYNAKMEECMNESTYKMAILGVGEDGHTAGLLPGYDVFWDVDQLVAGYENASTYRQRITITPKAIRRLDYGLVVSCGDAKRPALEAIVKDIKKSDITELPGLLLREIQTVDLFTDQNI